MRVIFLSPRYPPEMRQFTRGLAEVGAEVLGVGDGSPDPELRQYLAGYLEVPSLLDEEDVISRVHQWVRGHHIDLVLANWEPLVMTAARLNERFGLPGMSVDTVRGFCDKQLMKDRVQHITGLTEYYDRYRPFIVEDTLLRPGTPRRDWKSTLLSDGYIITRHPELAMAREMAVAAATTIQVYAS